MPGIRDKAHLYLDQYDRLKRIFEERFDYKLYFIGGTLLGYIRENDFLEHDKDMDVSYFSKHTNVCDVRKELITILKTLINDYDNVFLIRREYTIVKNFIKWKVTGHDNIDVMPTWHQNGMIYRPTFVGYRDNKSVILPITEKTFYGHQVYIPNHPERKLAHIYGDSWQIPDKSFQKSQRTTRAVKKILDKDMIFGRRVSWTLIWLTNEWQSLTTCEKLFVVFVYYYHNHSPLKISGKNKLRHKFQSYILSKHDAAH